MIKKLTAVALACVAVSAAAYAGPTATASADAWNSGFAHLELPSSGSGGPCEGRSIKLAGGTYRWRVFHVHWSYPDVPFWGVTRWIDLRAGWYTWRDCLEATSEGRPVGSQRGYLQRSQLFEQATGGPPAVHSKYSVAAFGTGWYDYGSALLRTGP